MSHYHPDQRLITNLTTIRRHVMLPEAAIGSVRVHDGKRVDPRDVVVQGAIPARHLILEGAAFLGLKKPENLAALMLVNVGDVVDVKQPLAGKSAKRGKRLFSPVRGIVAQVAQGRIILQEMPEVIDLEAGVKGKVVEVIPGRGVVIESAGALLQGLWGNNRRVLSTLRLEPDVGLESITQDALESKYSGTVVVTRRSLKQISLDVMRDQAFSGIIAPSMDADLRDAAMKMDGAIILLEGFGSARMSNLVYSLLSEYDRKQVTVDAFLPNRWESRRPEVIITVQTEQRPTSINPMLTLQKGMNVRVTRAPHAGINGKVVDLPKTPTLLENGLRVLCAQVELATGETAFVPMTNLEYYGK